MCDENKWREVFVEFCQQLRQILYEKGIASNPGVSDQWIIDELRKLLGITNSPHSKLHNFNKEK